MTTERRRMDDLVAGLIGWAEFVVPLAFCIYAFGPIVVGI